MTETADTAVAPRTQPRSRVLWVVPIAAVVLIGLVLYRQLRPPKQVVSTDFATAVVRPVPSLYELDDQRARRVALKAFIGRHKMLIVFVKTAGGAGPAAVSKSSEVSHSTPELRESPLLQTIRRDFARIQEAGAILHVISNFLIRFWRMSRGACIAVGWEWIRAARMYWKGSAWWIAKDSSFGRSSGRIIWVRRTIGSRR